MPATKAEPRAGASSSAVTAKPPPKTNTGFAAEIPTVCRATAGLGQLGHWTACPAEVELGEPPPGADGCGGQLHRALQPRDHPSQRGIDITWLCQSGSEGSLGPARGLPCKLRDGTRPRPIRPPYRMCRAERFKSWRQLGRRPDVPTYLPGAGGRGVERAERQRSEAHQAGAAHFTRGQARDGRGAATPRPEHDGACAAPR